jgi:hypothetical protein
MSFLKSFVTFMSQIYCARSFSVDDEVMYQIWRQNIRISLVFIKINFVINSNLLLKFVNQCMV